MDTLTYAIIHKESDRVIASGLNEEELLNLIGRMVYKEVVKDIWLPSYMQGKIISKHTVDTERLIKDIESQDVFEFIHCWHVR